MVIFEGSWHQNNWHFNAALGQTEKGHANGYTCKTEGRVKKASLIYPYVSIGIHNTLWLECFILPLLYCNSPVDCTIVSSPWVATLLWRFHSAWWWAVHSSVSMSWPGQQISLCPFCLFGTCQTSRMQLLEWQRALQMVKIIVSCLNKQHPEFLSTCPPSWINAMNFGIFLFWRDTCCLKFWPNSFGSVPLMSSNVIYVNSSLGFGTEPHTVPTISC